MSREFEKFNSPFKMTIFEKQGQLEGEEQY